MKHLSVPTLCLALVFGTAPVLTAQDTPDSGTEAAIAAAVKREAKRQDARGFILRGRNAEAAKDMLAASQEYTKALQALREIGGDVEPEHTDAVAGLSRASLALADASMRRGDFYGARAEIQRVINVDPKNKAALEMRAINERNIAESIDKTPHESALVTLATSETNRIEVAKLVQDGKLYYETGRLKEAETALRTAIKMDPDNKAASYYLDLVNGRRFLEELRLREVNSKELLLEVEQQWAEPVKRDALPVPNPYAHTNYVRTSPEREAIWRKLRVIRVNELLYDNLPLSAVVADLTEQTRRNDLEKRGINIILAPKADSAAAAAAAAGPGGAAVAPAPDLPPVPGGEAVDLAGSTVKITTPLRDVTLEQALNIISTVSERSIKWSVEDYGIVISPRAAEAVPLHTRMFRVDPNTFWQGLKNVTSFQFGESQNSGSGGGGRGGRGGGNRGGGNRGGNNFGGQNGQNGQGGGASYASVSIAPGGTGIGGQFGQQNRGGQAGRPGQQGQQGQGVTQAFGAGGGIDFLTEITPTAVVIPMVKQFFLVAGVNLDEPNKAVIFNDKLGLLMVRATMQDLDTIEKAVQTLNMTPPQLTIRAKFMEVTQDDSRALGFDWYLGNTLMNNGSIGMQGGSAPSYNVAGASSPANPSGVFPGPGAGAGQPGPFALPASATDNVVTSGLRNTAPALGTITGILTDPQFRFVVRALEQRGGTDLLSCPEVTTMSGRQAQIKVVDIRYIVTDLDLDQTATGGGTFR